jgi:hypothetical protein
MQEMKILEREAEIKRPPPQTPHPILINSSTINIDTKASLSLSLSLSPIGLALLCLLSVREP